MCHLKYYETRVSGSAMRKLLKHISQQTSEVASYTHLLKDFNSHFIPVHLIRHCWNTKKKRASLTLRPPGLIVSRNMMVRWATAELMSSTDPTMWQKQWASEVRITWLLRTVSGSRQRASTVTFSTRMKKKTKKWCVGNRLVVMNCFYLRATCQHCHLLN